MGRQEHEKQSIGEFVGVLKNKVQGHICVPEVNFKERARNRDHQ